MIVSNLRPIRAQRWVWSAVSKAAPTRALNGAQVLLPPVPSSPLPPVSFSRLREQLQQLDQDKED